MRPAAKALLSAARSAASVRAPLAAQKTQAFTGGGITGVLVRGECPTVSAPRWAQRRPALGIPVDDGVLCLRRGYSDLRTQPRGRHQLTACQATQVTACSVSRCSSRPLSETGKAPVSTRSSGGSAFGGHAISVGGLRWAASGPAPGCSTAARALAEETAAAPEALAVGQHAERDQAPVGAAASQVSECGEHTGETDDDEEAAKVDLIPWPPGGQRNSHTMRSVDESAAHHTRISMLSHNSMPQADLVENESRVQHIAQWRQHHSVRGIDSGGGACAGQQPSGEGKATRRWRVGARVRRGLRAAVQTYYTVVFYNTVTRVLKWLGAGSFFEWVTPRLERAYARVSGVDDIAYRM